MPASVLKAGLTSRCVVRLRGVSSARLLLDGPWSPRCRHRRGRGAVATGAQEMIDESEGRRHRSHGISCRAFGRDIQHAVEPCGVERTLDATEEAKAGVEAELRTLRQTTGSLESIQAEIRRLEDDGLAAYRPPHALLWPCGRGTRLEEEARFLRRDTERGLRGLPLLGESDDRRESESVVHSTPISSRIAGNPPVRARLIRPRIAGTGRR